MQYCFYFEVVDSMFQDIWNNKHLFKGLLVIIRGSFAQILFIVCRDIRTISVGVYIQYFFI